MAIPPRSFLRILVFAVAILTVGASGAILTAERGASAQSSGNTEDTRTEGQVVAINSLAPRPTVQIANMDGTVSLYFRDVYKLAESGVRFGDYVQIIGRKLNELEYEVDTLSVDSRAATNHTARSTADPYGDVYADDEYADDEYADDEYTDDEYADDDYGYDNYGYDDYGDVEPTPTATPRRPGANR